MPTGETMPNPVTTTRRPAMEVMPGCSAVGGARGPDGPGASMNAPGGRIRNCSAALRAWDRRYFFRCAPT
jgi:hypothetical protein